MKEYITDEEKRLLFKALSREKIVCKKIDKEYSSNKLTSIVESLENKFYYDKMIKQIRKDAVAEFISMIVESGTSEDVTKMLRDAADKFV